MDKKLKVTTTVKKHGSNTVETQEMLIVVNQDENLDKLVQMSYGSWYDIIEYTSEPVDIYVSDKYCHAVSIKLLKACM